MRCDTRPGRGWMAQWMAQRAVGVLLVLATLLPACAAHRGRLSLPGPVRLAVFEFEEYTVGAATGLGRTLADQVMARLADDPAVRLVDRESLDKTLAELEVASGALADPEMRLALGRLTGAQYLILGGVTTLGMEMRVDARIVEVESGQMKSVSVEGARAEATALGDTLSARLLQHFQND